MLIKFLVLSISFFTLLYSLTSTLSIIFSTPPHPPYSLTITLAYLNLTMLTSGSPSPPTTMLIPIAILTIYLSPPPSITDPITSCTSPPSFSNTVANIVTIHSNRNMLHVMTAPSSALICLLNQGQYMAR